MLGRHQHIQQRHDVEHFAAVNQFGFFADLRGYVQGAQLILQGQQAGAFAAERHHTSGADAIGNLPGYPARCLPSLQSSERFFGQFARCGQAVAPFQSLRCLAFFSTRDGRQAQHSALVMRCTGMRPKAFITIVDGCVAHHCVDSANYCLAAAPGVVAGQQVTPQYVCDEGLGCDKHLGLSTAKPVNALFGVPHNKDAGRTAPSTGIAT